MMKPVVRLHLYFAADAHLAVILRQGPTRQFRMILWNRETDDFEDGQWTKNKVYPDRCDLSPDGRHFLYFMLDGHWKSPGEGAYSAISKPPYWTALALFPEGNTWGGGGVFIDAQHALASGGDDVIGRADDITRVYLQEPGKGCTTGLRTQSGQPARLEKATRDRILPLVGAKGVNPMRDWGPKPSDRPMDQYDTQGGKLYRRTGGDMTLIRDFTDMSFEPIRAPYDWRTDDGSDQGHSPWHPLDDEVR